MKQLFYKIRDNHEYLFRVFLFFITLCLIIYVFPRQAKFKYEITKGKPWMHEKVIAPFDFSILKSTESIKYEEKIVKEQHTPVFNYKNNIFDYQAEQFVKQFEDKWITDKEVNTDYNFTFINLFKKKNLNNKLRKHVLAVIGLKALKEIYDKGIIQTNTDIEYSSSKRVLLKKESLAEKIFISDFHTVKSAADEIMNINLSDDEYDFLVPLLLSSIEHNILYDKNASESLLAYDLNNINKTQGLIIAGQVVINKGELITTDKYQKLISLKKHYEGKTWSRSSYFLVILGQIILVGVSLLILFFFIKQYRPNVFDNTTKISMILSLITFIVVLSTFVIKLDFNLLYAIPFCIIPIILKAFFDTRLALFAYIISILIIGFIVPNGFEFVFLQILAGIVSILNVLRMYKRIHLFLSAGKITIVYLLIYVGICVTHDGSFKGIEYNMIFQLLISAGFTLFAYPLIFAFEKIFNLVSDVSLLELSDTNNPLLRRLAEESPGTFQHSLQVANLVEEGVLSIGGNALLARVGAIYHDIGKLKNPMYFIENQNQNFNPHDDISFNESAEIIINHVHDGVEIAKENNLPDELIDFIRTHHGTTTVQYFYNQVLAKCNKEDIDINKFIYPGPKPFSKETAVLMMADSLEAATRSIKEPTVDKIDDLIEKVVNNQITQDQFVNANITFKEITVIKKLFKNKLVNIHHVRLEY